MTGTDVQKLVFAWLKENYPTWEEDWIEPDFDGYASLPIEIKMIPAFYLLEKNMINGGWAQVLWNCFGNWRELIAIVREGYELIGGASEQLAALDTFYLFCERDEAECEKAIANEDGSLESFAEFTERSYGTSENKWEMLFWSGTDIYWKRISWLEENESYIRSLLDDLKFNDQ